jgi:hypothetical protein
VAVLFPATFASENLLINEICWMGNFDSYTNEWIELYNPNSFEVSLESWKIETESGSININLKGKIGGNEFYLLERTDDNSAKGKKADLIYKGSLNNKGEILNLYKGETLIDTIDCSEKWFKGDNEDKRTMERTENGWQTGPEGGTPKEENSIKEVLKKEIEIKRKDSSPFIPALLTSFFSALIMIFLKKSLNYT